jgi:HEAT repeat protein
MAVDVKRGGLIPQFNTHRRSGHPRITPWIEIIMHKTRHYLIALLASLMLVPLARGAEPSAREHELIGLLRSGAPAEKAVTCKQLAIHGTRAAVPELAKLLSDEQLASWSRIALEAIPDKEADDALRNATHSLQGKLLVGVINSIGVRRDAAAIETLASRLQDPDAEVASAAAVALGHIGTPAAAKPLRAALAAAPVKVRSAVAEGCILCAERHLAEEKLADSAAIYDEVRKADVPRQRILEATRGAILARNQQGIPLLIEQLRSPDKGFFQIGLSTAREFPGPEVDKVLARNWSRPLPRRRRC